MKKTKNIIKKLLSAVLAVVMLLSLVPMSANAADIIKAALTPSQKLNIATISDIHYYPEELTNNYCDAFMESLEASIGRESYESDGILNSALAALEAHAKEKDMKYVIVSGDLTADGEYVGHTVLAEKLEQFEKDTGLNVLVINGNHDINRTDTATTFENGYEEKARAITPEEFLEVYENLGYDLAYHKYVPTTGKANMLSYSVSDNGYRFIVMDTAKYSADITKDGNDVGETAGAMSDEFLNWVLAEIADAKANGETVIGVSHHNFIPHFVSEYEIVRGFNVDGWEEITETLADAGMHYNLTGHIHMNDNSQLVSDNGETMTEISMSSVTAYPNYFRELEITTDGAGKTTVDVESLDVDCVLPVTVEGVTFDKPFRVESMKRTYFDERGASGFAGDFIGHYIKKFAPLFAEKGVLPALKEELGLDLEDLLGGLLSGVIGENGIAVGKLEIFTVKNIMSFLEDFLGQIQEHYLTDTDATIDYLSRVIDKLLEIQVSELPNDSFYDEYGIGSKTEPGTLDDLIVNTILYAYNGSLDLSQDKFMLDAINNIEYGDVADEIFDTLVDMLANDLLQAKLLNDIELRVDTLFPKGSFGYVLGKGLDAVINALFLGDTTILNVADSALSVINKLGILEYASLMGILEHYMDEYITDSLIEGIGHSIANIVRGFADDYNFPDDLNATIVYDGKVPVEATRKNYRLPTALSVTFGEDSTSRNLSWYTKTSVTGSDIEIVEYTETPTFSGESIVPSYIKVTADTQRTTRSYPGIDFGVIGIMQYEFPMNRHTVTVSGLEPGKKYLYRVGDASRGWWSETGTFVTEDGGNDTTFIHITDPQSVSEIQYETFAEVIKTAYEMYPDASFTVATGDLADHGNNFNHWRWLLDGSSDTLMNTVMMPVSGNHEDKGEYATVTNFTISNAPEQDTITGIYYSFDYNNTHFAMLNSNDLNEDEGLSDAQIEWLINDMQSSDADWKFVALHKAVYSNGSHYDDDDVIAIREQLSVLMPQLGIDMVFQGHDHVYLRTDSMINNKVEEITTSTTTFNGKEYTVKESPVGSVYVIGGCSGVKVYKQKDPALTDELFPRAEKIVDAEYSVFSGVQIVDNTLYFDAYEVNPDSGETTNIDSFAIRKDLSVKKGTGVGTGNGFFDNISVMFEEFFAKVRALFEQIFSFLAIDVIG